MTAFERVRWYHTESLRLRVKFLSDLEHELQTMNELDRRDYISEATLTVVTWLGMS
jgi:hypothetical protein